MDVRSLDHLAELVDAYDAAVVEEQRWRRAAEVMRKRIQDEIGEAGEATLGGAPAFSWKRTGRFNTARFGQDHPDLLVKYTRPVTYDEVDEGALRVDWPDLHLAYRGRVFLRK